MTAFKYYLGLDMGTNSVGWAATDPEYRLLKAKGKDLWGIREFNEAYKIYFKAGKGQRKRYCR